MKNLNELEDLLTELDQPYESKDELKVGRMLDRYGIPFFYKQATIIYHEGKNEIWKPSFTLYSYGGAVIDYVAGTGGNPREQVLNRDRIYRYNQIPAVVLGPPTVRSSAAIWSAGGTWAAMAWISSQCSTILCLIWS